MISEEIRYVTVHSRVTSLYFYLATWNARIRGTDEAIKDNTDLLDAYKELLEDLQNKIKRALAEGHAHDNAWSGCVEINGPGMNGYRTPVSEKARLSFSRRLVSTINSTLVGLLIYLIFGAA